MRFEKPTYARVSWPERCNSPEIKRKELFYDYNKKKVKIEQKIEMMVGSIYTDKEYGYIILLIQFNKSLPTNTQ